MTAAAKFAWYWVLLKMPPKIVPLKIKFHSPKAYELTFTRLNCETRSWIGLQGSAAGFHLPGQRSAEPGEGRQRVCLSVSQSVSATPLPTFCPILRVAPMWAGTKASPVARKAWQDTQCSSCLSPQPTQQGLHGAESCFLHFFCQASMPGQILVGTIATNPPVNLIS